MSFRKSYELLAGQLVGEQLSAVAPVTGSLHRSHVPVVSFQVGMKGNLTCSLGLETGPVIFAVTLPV